MIEDERETIKVQVLRPLPSGKLVPAALGGFVFEGTDSQAELVPYINGVSNERDPMMRPVINKCRFLHMTTLQKWYPETIFRDEAGEEFGIKDIIGKLYN